MREKKKKISSVVCPGKDEASWDGTSEAFETATADPGRKVFHGEKWGKIGENICAKI
jgi:hypothetical protein